MTRAWIGVVLALACCKGDAAKPQPVGGASGAGSARSAGSDQATAVGSAASARPRTQVTDAQRADYKQHMQAGWALQKQKKWSEATEEFEAALTALDGDQRALAELGFSAMNAGDYDQARTADEQAVRVAIDSNVKAAALFNLGAVELKLGDVDGARRSFTASLQLRPNKTVEAELAKLGAGSNDKPFCPAGMDPCGCVYDYAAGHPDTGTGCNVATSPLLPRAWKIYTVAHMAYVESFVLDEHNNLLFVSARSDDHVRHIGDMAISKVETKSIGAHKLLWIEQAEHATVITMRDDNTDVDIDEDSQLVTICVLGDATTPTRCPLREVTVDRVYDGQGSGKTETVADVRIADDGTATVKLQKGPSCCGLDALVGAHKLW